MSSDFDMLEEPLAAPIDVQVQWCGISYPVSANSDGNIGNLKRQTCELAGLPSKRQKHMNPDGNVLNDEYPLGWLQDPPRTDLIGLNKKVAYEAYRNHFHAKKPICTVKATKDRLEDFDKSKTRLYKGKYKVGSMEMNCLIKCYTASQDRPVLHRSITLMRTWSHENVVVLENLYKEQGNSVQRLVLANTVNGTLQGYIKSRKGKKHNADGTFTGFFTKIIRDLCAVLGEMVKRKICPINLSMQNLYLMRMENAEPQLKILFDNVDRLDVFREKQMLITLCEEIKAICTTNDLKQKNVGTEAFCEEIKAICTTNDLRQKHEGTEAFCDFLGKEARMFFGRNFAKTAMHYPISWTNDQKARYLIDLIPSSTDVRIAINECGIEWPKDLAGNMCEELQTLKQFVDKENQEIREEKEPFYVEIRRLQDESYKIKSEEPDGQLKTNKLGAIAEEIAKNQEAAAKVRPEKVWNYDIKYGHDLVRLARNLWKHFYTYPSSIKLWFGNKDAVLAALEKWCPGVWYLMYNAVGLLC